MCNDSTGNTQPLSQYEPEPKISRPHRTKTTMSHEHNSIGGIIICEDQAMAPHLPPAAHPNRFLCRHVKTSSICSDLQLLPSSVHRTIIPERSGSMKTTAASGTANIVLHHSDHHTIRPSSSGGVGSRGGSLQIRRTPEGGAGHYESLCTVCRICMFQGDPPLPPTPTN